MNITSDVILCHTCLRIIKNNKIPGINVANGLNLDYVPEELRLKDLEQQLIARSLLFLKIQKLPKTRMKANVDNVINVPIECQDISHNISKLPRNPDDAQIVAVQLKRRLEYKNSHLQEFIRPDVLKEALKTLKRLGNEFYQDIEFNEDFMEDEEESLQMETESQAKERNEDERWEKEMKKIREENKALRAKRLARRNALKENSEGTDNQRMETNDDQSSEESDNDDDSDSVLKAVKQNQSKQNSTTFLVPKDLSHRVVKNDSLTIKSKEIGESNISIQIAPGEGKIPSNLMRDEHFDVKAFPKHFPTGKFGLHFPRKHKLSAQMYFNQRLLNCDERFSKDPCFLFTAAYFIERQGIEKQISISGNNNI